MVIAFYIDGSIEQFNEMTLEKAQDIVGGYVELVTIGNIQLLVNEEGLLRNLPTNKTISKMFDCHIVGNVVALSEQHLWK